MQRVGTTRDNPYAGLETRTVCYHGGCPKPVILKWTSFLHLMITQIIKKRTMTLTLCFSVHHLGSAVSGVSFIIDTDISHSEKKL
jgi:hypothetical protein